MTTQRHVLITGGAGGIGQALARHFAGLGDAVTVTDVNADALAGVAAEVPSAASVACDITDAEAINAALDAAEAAHGPVDVLVNNAGILTIHGPLLEFQGSDMDLILRTNVTGTFQMTQAVAKRMIAHGTRGAIVNISSIGGRQPTPGMGAYESSKAAVDGLTRWAAIELAANGIRVNAVAPGPVATPMLAMGMPEGSPQRAAWEQRIPLRALAPVEQVANAVAFLAGDAASHITGVSLAVDGGQLLV